MSFVRFWRARLAVVLLIAAGLASCYVPDDFKAEIRVASNGDFAMSYEGILTWAPLYSDIKDGKLAPADIPAKIALFEEDLRRDTNFKEIKSIGKGRYQVRYE
ncbi:MAG: hypothetical protein HQL34_06870, partial [Alphaproteobacteria bacterium]|nr:hypothetical protein [Alphaproteobacteria bacterium]